MAAVWDVAAKLPTVSASRAIAICCVGIAIACSEPTAPGSRHTRVSDEWVTGAAAAAVDPQTGLFVLAPPLSRVLTIQAAESAAVAHIRFALNPAMVGNSRATLEQDHGGAIAQWDALLPCGRTVYAQTPFDVAPEPAPSDLQRYVTSTWAVTLCGPDGLPDVSMGITDVRTGARMVGPDFVLGDVDSLRNAHSSIGLPAGWDDGLWVTPEDAVRELFLATNVRIRAVPAGHVRWGPGMTVPAYLNWRLELETPVIGSFESGEVSAPVASVIVRRVATNDTEFEFMIPIKEQPPHVWIPYPVQFDPLIVDSVAVPLIHPIELRRVWFPGPTLSPELE